VRLSALLRQPPSRADVEAALDVELGRFAGSEQQVPNAWTVRLADRDLRRRHGELAGWSDGLAAHLVDEHARLGLPTAGMVSVSFASASELAPGRFQVQAAVAPGDPVVVQQPDQLLGRPRLTLPAGGEARHGTPRAAGIDHEVMLPAGTFVIGRDRSADLRLLDATVSPRHVTLEVTADRIRMTDLGSLNGTKVDGVPSVTADLVDGNRIELGGATLLFHRDDPDDDGGREGGEGELPTG